MKGFSVPDCGVKLHFGRVGIAWRKKLVRNLQQGLLNCLSVNCGIMYRKDSNKRPSFLYSPPSRISVQGKKTPALGRLPRKSQRSMLTRVSTVGTISSGNFPSTVCNKVNFIIKCMLNQQIRLSLNNQHTDKILTITSVSINDIDLTNCFEHEIIKTIIKSMVQIFGKVFCVCLPFRIDLGSVECL